MFDIGSTIAVLIGKVIDRVAPDKTKAAEMQHELAKLTINGELQQMMGELDLLRGQLEVNKVEAASSSVFVAGWRPFIGWVCGTGLLYAVLLKPFLDWVCTVQNWPIAPDLDTAVLVTTMGTLLGIGTMRTVERVKGKVPPGR